MQEKSVSVKDFYEKLDVNNLRYSYYKNCLELRNRIEYLEYSTCKPYSWDNPCLSDDGIYVSISSNEKEKYKSLEMHHERWCRIPWDIIFQVDCQEKGYSVCFVFYDKEKRVIADFDCKYWFGISSINFNHMPELTGEEKRNFCKHLAAYFTEMAQLPQIECLKQINKINAIESVQYAKELKKQGFKNSLIYEILALSLIDSCPQKAIEELGYASFLATNEEHKVELYVKQAEILTQMGLYAKGRETLIRAMEFSKDVQRLMVNDKFKETERIMKENGQFDGFINQEYKRRRFLMPIEDEKISGCVCDGIATYRMTNIPDGVNFSTGFPVPQTLYVAHPHIVGLYIPYEEAVDYFFAEQVSELCTLLQALGATEITINCLKGKNIEELQESSYNNYAKVGIKRFSATGNGYGDDEHKSIKSSKSNRSMSRKLDPIEQPYVPSNLLWYNSKKDWQNLAEQRVHGNLLEYEDIFSTKNAEFLSDYEKKGIEAKVGFLWFKTRVGSSSTERKEIHSEEETQWQISVKFKSTKEFASKEMPAYCMPLEAKCLDLSSPSASESEYKKEIQELCKEGEITQRERRLLEKIRVNLGISKERAQEIEGSLSNPPQLSQDEKEYLSEYREIISEGEISERDKLFLEKYKRVNNISEERAKYIEGLA